MFSRKIDECLKKFCPDKKLRKSALTGITLSRALGRLNSASEFDCFTEDSTKDLEEGDYKNEFYIFKSVESIKDFTGFRDDPLNGWEKWKAAKKKEETTFLDLRNGRTINCHSDSSKIPSKFLSFPFISFQSFQ